MRNVVVTESGGLRSAVFNRVEKFAGFQHYSLHRYSPIKMAISNANKLFYPEVYV
ncbi:hypothetical protein L9F63_001698, partial [Diploptera punctata]